MNPLTRLEAFLDAIAKKLSGEQVEPIEPKTREEYFLKEIVENANSGGLTPTGTKTITSNGIHDVTEYASAEVNVPNPSTGTKNITANGTYDVTNYASAAVNVSPLEWRSTLAVTNNTASSLSISFPKQLLSQISGNYYDNWETVSLAAGNSVNIPMCRDINTSEPTDSHDIALFSIYTTKELNVSSIQYGNTVRAKNGMSTLVQVSSGFIDGSKSKQFTYEISITEATVES